VTVRVWAEYLEPKDLMEKKVIKLLKEYDVTVGVAFPPGSMNKDFEKMIGKYEQAGVDLALWPLLEDGLGYWPNERNVNEFSDYVEEICDWADDRKVAFSWLAVDMEPPIYQMETLKGGTLSERAQVIKKVFTENRDRSRFYDTSAGYNRLIERLHARGKSVIAASADLVMADIKSGSVGLQDMLETPLSTVNFDVISFMIYTSMLVGYSRGLVTPRDARWHLFRTMRAAKETLWNRAGVSIGVTYTGKLGDEPYYATPAELLPDMKAAKAALIDDISIYNLEGIIRSDRPEEWFETLKEAEAETPPRSIKVDAAHSAARFAVKFL